ncbi:MAG: zinc-ribbon domain-containing protein [Lachnospiraceae bacterium]|nr:zinc-ribbon domain-containing protein [Lachnospiraceae bacterium]
MSKFCHNCGTKLPDDAVFCSGCGTKVKITEQPTDVVNTNHIETVQPITEPVQPIVETATTLEQEKTEENVNYTNPVEPPKAEEPITYASPVEPPKAEEPITYASPVEPPKAEEPITYASPVEPPKAEEPITYASPVEPPKAEEPITYTSSVMPTESASYVGGTSYERPVSSVPPVSPIPADQPIPGFGAPGANKNKQNKPKKKKKGLVVFLVIVLLLAAGAAVVWFLDSKGIIEIFSKEEESTYKEAIDLYVKGIEEQEIDTFLDAYGSFLVEEFANGDGEVFMEEIYEEYESEVGEGVSIAYKVTKEKEYSESKLNKLQEELEEDYDFKGTIDKAYDITTEFTIEGDDGETEDRVKFLVVEIEGQWYLAEFDN